MISLRTFSIHGVRVAWSSECALPDEVHELLDRDGAVDALAWPRPFHITATTLDAFPQLRAHATRTVREGWIKSVLDPREALSRAAFHASTRPAVMLFPRVSHGSPTTRVAAISPADALGELVMSSPLVAADAMPFPREQMRTLRRLVDSTRHYRVLLGADALVQPGVALERVREALDGDATEGLER